MEERKMIIACIDNLNEKNFCLEINHSFQTQEQKQLKNVSKWMKLI